MATQTKVWQGLSCAGGLALAVTGAGMALSGLKRGLGHPLHLLVNSACAGLTDLPSVILAAWHALPLCALIQEPAAERLFRVLVSSWPAILAIVGA